MPLLFDRPQKPKNLGGRLNFCIILQHRKNFSFCRVQSELSQTLLEG